MPKRIPVQSIIVNRDGKRFRPPIGQAFDFTAEELEDIKNVNPDAVKKIEVVVESQAPQTDAEKLQAEADRKAEDARIEAEEKAKAVAKAEAEKKAATGKNVGGKTSASDL